MERSAVFMSDKEHKSAVRPSIMSLSDLDKVRYDSNYSSSMYDSNTTLKFQRIEKTYRYDKA